MFTLFSGLSVGVRGSYLFTISTVSTVTWQTTSVSVTNRDLGGLFRLLLLFFTEVQSHRVRQEQKWRVVINVQFTLFVKQLRKQSNEQKLHKCVIKLHLKEEIRQHLIDAVTFVVSCYNERFKTTPVVAWVYDIVNVCRLMISWFLSEKVYARSVFNRL